MKIKVIILLFFCMSSFFAFAEHSISNNLVYFKDNTGETINITNMSWDPVSETKYLVNSSIITPGETLADVNYDPSFFGINIAASLKESSFVSNHIQDFLNTASDPKHQFSFWADKGHESDLKSEAYFAIHFPLIVFNYTPIGIHIACKNVLIAETKNSKGTNIFGLFSVDAGIMSKTNIITCYQSNSTGTELYAPIFLRVNHIGNNTFSFE